MTAMYRRGQHVSQVPDQDRLPIYCEQMPGQDIQGRPSCRLPLP